MTTIREKLNVMKEMLDNKKELLEKLNEEIDQLSNEIKETEQNLLKTNDPEFLIDKLKEYDLIKMITNNFDCDFKVKDESKIETTIDFGNNKGATFELYNHDVGRKENSITVRNILEKVLHHYVVEVVADNVSGDYLKEFFLNGADLSFPMYDGFSYMNISLRYEKEHDGFIRLTYKTDNKGIPLDVSINSLEGKDLECGFYAKIGSVDINDNMFDAINILFNLKSEQIESIIKEIYDWMR